MKQILSLWDACPQGGKHRRSVFLRLLLFVCMLVTAQAGWADSAVATTVGTYSFGSSNIGGANKFAEISTNSVFVYRNSSYSSSQSGIKANSSNDSGFVFYLTSPMTLSATIYQNNSTNETVTLYVKTVTSTFFQGLVDGTANSTTVSAPTLTNHGTAAKTSTLSAKGEFTINYGTTLNPGYYYVYAVSSASSVNTYHRAITLTASGPTAPTFSPASGSLKQNAGTVTATSATSGSTVYYKWSSSSTAETFTYASYAADGWTAGTADAATATATAPNAEGTYYLNAVAYKAGEASTVSNQAYTIDGTAPTLSSANPANGATGVATSGTIVLTFNEAIASVDATKFSLSSGTKDGVAIDGSDNTKVNITYSGMANNTAITLSTAAEAVADAAGNKSAALSDITFTTVAAAIEPTATFNNGSYTIGGSALDLNSLWTSNSSGAVTYTVTNANGTGATISGSDFSATTAGTATVKATQAAVSGSFSSIEKTATITVNASGPNYYILSGKCNVPLTPGMNSATYQVLKYNGTVAATTDISSSITDAASFYYNSTSASRDALISTSNYSSGSSSARTMQAIKLQDGKTMTITLNSKTFSQMDVIYRCASSDAKSITIDGTTYDTNDQNAHVATINKTFSGTIVLSNSSGKEYDVFVVLKESSAETYAITKADTQNGSISTSVGGTAVTEAAEGVTVAVAAAPASGYQTNTITVTKTDDSSTEVTTTGTGNNRSFTMPAYPVTVTATFAEIVKQNVTLAWATPSDKAMIVGGTYTNAATATASTDGVLGGGVTYASSDNSVATVSDEGVVTAVGVGDAIITASFAATTEYKAATPITYTVTVTNPNVAPTISTQPKAATYTQNATATPLSVTATGNPAPNYQWYNNGTTNSNSGGSPISGASNATYTPSTATAGTTYYYCVVSNGVNPDATSNAVAVTVNEATARDASNPAVDVKSDSYGNHTFLDVANTTHNTVANSTNYLTYGAYYLTSLQTKPTWLVDNKRSSSSTSYSYSSATSEGFLSTGGPSSVTSGYGQVQLRQSQGNTFYVTGTTGVAILAKGGSDAGKGVQISINEIAADGTTSAVGSSVSDHSNAVAKVEHGSALSPSKYYEVIVNGESENNVLFYQIRFTQGNVADIIEDPTVVPTDENATFNTTTKSVTFTTNEAGGETYYVVGTTREETAATIATTGTQAEGATSVNVSTQYSAGQDVVISAVTKKDNKYSNIVYLNLAYNGPVAAQIGNSAAINIQSGNSHTITPFITNGSGKRLTFDQDEDASIDYSEYFDFTFSEVSHTGNYITLDTEHGTVNTRDGANNKAAAGSTIVVHVTAEPKEAPAVTLNYVTDVTLEKDITFTVTAEAAGDDITWCDLFWDEACTIPVSQNHGGVTGQAKAKNMVFTDFPNGKVIYVKVNSPATKVCFYYNNSDTSKPTASVTNVDDMTSIKNNNGKTYRYRQCLPIYKNAQGAGLDGDKVWVTLAGYEGENGENIGDFINMEFTLAANNNRPLAPTYSPETTSSSSGEMTKMTTTQASTANGDANGTVMAKYSTNNSYTIIQLVSMPSDNNPRTLNVGKGSVGVFSTVYASTGKMRKTSGVQVVDGVISPMSNVYYSYYPAQKEVKLSFDPEEITVHTEGDHKGEYTQPTLNITAEDPSHVTPITYSIVGDAHGTTINASTGALTFTNSTPGVVTVKASYAGDEYGSNSYAAAEATYIIYQIDPAKEVILIKPGSRNFTSEQTVVLEGAPTLDGYYTTSPTTAEVPFDPDNLEGWTLLKAGTTTTLHLTETATVQAIVPSSDNYRTQQTFTKITIPAPTLYPDGVTSTYYFHSGELDGGKLKVTAATTQAGASVYYVVDGDDEDLLNGGGTRYDGSTKIQVDGTKTTTIIYAVTRLADGNQSEIVRGVYTRASNVIQPAFKVNDGEEFGSGETMDIASSDQVYIIDKSQEEGAITYYTVDGSSPTTSSMTYTGPFHINKSGTVVKAITVYDGNVSPISTATFNLTSGANRFWEANSSTCDSNGKLKINGGKSGAVINTTTDPTNGVADITATFGSIYQDSKDDWKHISIGEESKGDPIDGVGTYQIATGSDVADENGELYTHMNSSSSLKVHERTFKLPARGAYVRFEPEKDGDLTIWALQNGGVYYTDATEGKENFLSGFVRKRPVYMIDEQGICQAATEIKAAGTLSDNWNNINRDNLKDKGESQSGVEQKLYTKAEAQTIYDMYSDKIGVASSNNIQDMLIYLNDGDHQDAAKAGIGDDTTTGEKIGVCIPSASYMRYTYKVRAGKTYFFFAQRTKLGIRGFRFDPDETYTKQAITIDPGATTISDAISNAVSAEKQTENVTVSRTFKKDTWAALVLPFSVSRQQLKQVFGENTSVLHVDRQENYTLYLHKHHYGMIVAGTPILIYPSGKDADIVEPVFNGVQIETTNITPTGDSKVQFIGSICKGQLLKNDMYINAAGNFTQWLGNPVYVSGTHAWLRGVEQGAKLSLRYTSYDEEDDDPIATGIQIVTDGEGNFGEVNGNGDIYNISGQLVGKKGTSKDKLAKGVYIQNGKKVVIK